MADSVILLVIENSFIKSGKLRHLPEVYHSFVDLDEHQAKRPYRVSLRLGQKKNPGRNAGAFNVFGSLPPTSRRNGLNHTSRV